MTQEMTNYLYQLLKAEGIYSRVKDASYEDFEAFTGPYGFKTLDLHCPNCKEDKTFVYKDYEMIKGLGLCRVGSGAWPASRAITYICPTCENKLFYLFYYNGNEIIKLAQYPTLYDVSRDVLKKYQKNSLIDRESFRQLYKAEECASIGYYVAAYTYMRRVYETLLMSIFTQNKDEIGVSEDDFKSLRSDEKLKTIKNYLAIDDEIYAPLYGLLSSGIHAMSEEQCCEVYAILKAILLDILAEQKARNEKMSNRKQLKDLFAKRQYEMKQKSES